MCYNKLDGHAFVRCCFAMGTLGRRTVYINPRCWAVRRQPPKQHVSISNQHQTERQRAKLSHIVKVVSRPSGNPQPAMEQDVGAKTSKKQPTCAGDLGRAPAPTCAHAAIAKRPKFFPFSFCILAAAGKPLLPARDRALNVMKACSRLSKTTGYILMPLQHVAVRFAAVKQVLFMQATNSRADLFVWTLLRSCLGWAA
jgi:hypothetical protein